MAIEQRISGRLSSPGPFVARITNLRDTTYMGSVEVVIEKGSIGDALLESQVYPVQYLSPFYGATAPQFEGSDPRNFDDVQKSYGMWFVPPDVGTKVLVIFVDGDPNQGYWIGCIPHSFQNQMIPGIAASQNVYLTPEQELKYGTKNLPVAEFHKRSKKDFLDPNSQKKPVHPFADRLLAQGLLLDTVRGVTSSSARREAPSSVFGISTPGPLDPASKNKHPLGYSNNRGDPTVVSRLGGSQLIMDDGDAAGLNELVRIRTRTGHQILLHNSSDLIYIANSKGTAWIELTSNGKIDIYANDSVSIHSEADFNFRADRDINIEAGRNINMNAFGGFELNCVDRFDLICDKDGKIAVGGNLNVLANSNIKAQAGETVNLSSEGNLRLSSGSSINFGAAGNIISTGAEIHQNGPAAEAAEAPDLPSKLPLFSLPNRSPDSGWSNGKFYKASNIDSIMQRVPTHEPWDHHESTSQKFSPENTNVMVEPKASSSTDETPASQPVNTNPVAVPASKNASSNETYLQSILVNAGITNPIKLAAWMAQCRQESGGFRYLKELGPDSYFAKYEDNRGLGNSQPGDGAKFKGRGFIQLTGRDVYRKMTKYFNAGINFEERPELVESLEWAAKSVLFYFNVYKPLGFKNKTMTQPYRDTTAFWDDIVSVTALVNGGSKHLAERRKFYDEYKAKFEANGVVPQGTVGTGSSSVLTDSYGNPIRTGQ
jgi:putative chitinase